MPLPFVAQLFIAFVVQVVGHLLMPRPKQPRGPEFEEMEAPTADAGSPVPVVFGEVEIRAPNVLWYGDKETVTYEVGA